MATTSKKAKKTKPAKSRDRGLQRSPQVTVHKAANIGGGKATYDIKAHVPPDVVLQGADNLNVLHTEFEFVLSFMQMQPPIVLEGQDHPGEIEARCFARIAVHPGMMPAFINTLIRSWNRYSATYMPAEDANDANVEATEGAAEGSKAG